MLHMISCRSIARAACPYTRVHWLPLHTILDKLPHLRGNLHVSSTSPTRTRAGIPCWGGAMLCSHTPHAAHHCFHTAQPRPLCSSSSFQHHTTTASCLYSVQRQKASLLPSPIQPCNSCRQPVACSCCSASLSSLYCSCYSSSCTTCSVCCSSWSSCWPSSAACCSSVSTGCSCRLHNPCAPCLLLSLQGPGAGPRSPPADTTGCGPWSSSWEGARH